MAKITTGNTFGITKQQMLAVRMMAEGKTPAEIAPLIFDVRCDDDPRHRDERKYRRAVERLRRWRREPKVLAAYAAVLREDMLPYIAHAAHKLGQQVDDSNGWLANKASNDIIGHFGRDIFGADEREIVVRVEGMPEIGIPVDDSADAE